MTQDSARPTAIVTGASSGIGAQFARLLGEKGYDLVLVARSKDRLEQLGAELADRHGIEAEVLPADLALEEDVATVARRIRAGGPIEVVVNDAGIGWYGPFADQDPGSIHAMLGVNVVALTMLSRAALDVMMPRRCGGLLNLSSTASFVPGPRSAVYHATKAYVTSLSEALHEEARACNVHVTALCPGITPTGFQETAGFSERKLPSAMVGDARAVAAAGLAALWRNEPLCVPGRLNKVAVLAARHAPAPAVRWGSRLVLEHL